MRTSFINVPIVDYNWGNCGTARAIINPSSRNWYLVARWQCQSTSVYKEGYRAARGRLFRGSRIVQDGRVLRHNGRGFQKK